MSPQSVQTAVAEAQRFIKLAGDLPAPEKYGYPAPSPQSAAVKRASMDLTRALAKLRRPM